MGDGGGGGPGGGGEPGGPGNIGGVGSIGGIGGTVSGPDGGPIGGGVGPGGSGGGPADRPRKTQTGSSNSRRSVNANVNIPNFKIDPAQVMTDINLYGMWGSSNTMPQMTPLMNPFNMYGSQQGFNWPGYFGGFK